MTTTKPVPKELNILQVNGTSGSATKDNPKVLEAIRMLDPRLTSLHSKRVYFIASTTPIQPTVSKVLLYLLGGYSVEPVETIDELTFVTVPRIGTISPWSSKATNILNRCGFEDVTGVVMGMRWVVGCAEDCPVEDCRSAVGKLLIVLQDRMIQSAVRHPDSIESIFAHYQPGSLGHITLDDQLEKTNVEFGLALSTDELLGIREYFNRKDRNPTDAELMMYALVNSEHCRHKIFNSLWEIDNEPKNKSLFSMIRETHQTNPEGTLVAYDDNACVIAGNQASVLACNLRDRLYQNVDELSHVIFKAETHNHPTAIYPYEGAATGAGGEIRDGSATGRAGKPKAGLCGFAVSSLKIPEFRHPWENTDESAVGIAVPLSIMIQGPLGAASFNNEFGRPCLGGFFRTLEEAVEDRDLWFGYHKPIMYAGGIGRIKAPQVQKKKLSVGNLLITIGGPAMLIGLGGGSASSQSQGQYKEEIEFSSVQRSNPEMQRRCQEVIDQCANLGERNPILSIHDVGAGGLSNALPEIVRDSDLGAKIWLRDIPNDDRSMTPMQIWCNEAQERYVLAIDKNSLKRFRAICERELCPFAVVGVTTQSRSFVVHDFESTEPSVVDLDMDFLFENNPQKKRIASRLPVSVEESAIDKLDFQECVTRVLHMPSVADKSFLVTIGDRTVTGLVHRDQMVGPWQVPVADAAVTLASYESYEGEAMAVGERTPIAVINAPASARMAIGEALTNLRSTNVSSLSDVKLGANWMAATEISGEEAKLYDAVEAASRLCIDLSLSIPVGKDSMSMQAMWYDKDSETDKKVYSPVSLIVSAFATLQEVRGGMTPQLHRNEESRLLLVDLGQGLNRLGMSSLFQAFNLQSAHVPDVEAPKLLAAFFEAIGKLAKQKLILAYHDRSDGGLFVCLIEMAFAGRVGLSIDVGEQEPNPFLFNEELGAVIQVRECDLEQVMAIFTEFELASVVHDIGTTDIANKVSITKIGTSIFESTRTELHRLWSETSYHIQSLRDSSDCAQQQFDQLQDEDDPGLNCRFGEKNFAPFNISGKHRPQIAIMRERGVNGQMEMAAAFTHAGFDAYDVMMTDLIDGREDLRRYHGLAMCGGFSFGDVLGAGRGWAATIHLESNLKGIFTEFFSDENKFALGVCNGCQVLTELNHIIPGADHWPLLLTNRSTSFEARLAMVEVTPSGSIFTEGLDTELLPVVVAHGEGRMKFRNKKILKKMRQHGQIMLRYATNNGEATMKYPANPNGSEYAVAAVSNLDGRIAAMMPHPERSFRTVQYSWAPPHWGEYSPWMELFRNARRWLDSA